MAKISQMIEAQKSNPDRGRILGDNRGILARTFRNTLQVNGLGYDVKNGRKNNPTFFSGK